MKYNISLFGTMTKYSMLAHLILGLAVFLIDPFARLVGGGESVGMIFFGFAMGIFELYLPSTYLMQMLFGQGCPSPEMPFYLAWLTFGTIQFFIIGLFADWINNVSSRKAVVRKG